MTDSFSRILVCSRMDALRRFSQAQNELVQAEASEIASFNTYGPKDKRYLESLLALAEAQQTAKEFDRSLETGLTLERYLKGTGLFDLKLENLHMIIQNELARRGIIDADEISVSVLKELQKPVAGMWSTYWKLKILSLHADILQEKGMFLSERKVREEVYRTFAKELGAELYETLLARLYLGECEERLKDWESALGDYETVYAAFQIKQLFNGIEEKTSLLAHCYRCIKNLGDEQRAVESRIWILNILKTSFPKDSRQRHDILVFMRDSNKKS